MWQRPGTGALRSHVPQGEGMGGCGLPLQRLVSRVWAGSQLLPFHPVSSAVSIFQGESQGRGVTQKGGAARQSWSHRSAVPAGRLAMAVGMGVRSKEGHPRGDGDEEDNGCPCLMAKGMEGGKVIHRVSPLDRKSLQVSPGHSVPVRKVLGHSAGCGEQIWNEPVGELENSVGPASPTMAPTAASPQERRLSASDLTPVVSPQPREPGPYCAHSTSSAAIFNRLPPFRSTSLFFGLF